VAADVLTTLTALPLAIAAVVWLVSATDTAGLVQHGPTLLLMGGLIWAVQQLPSFIIVEVFPGRNGESSYSFDGALTWSAWLIFGPNALWVSLGLLVVEQLRHRGQWAVPALRWTALRNIAVAVVINVFAPLASFWLYEQWGGVFPFPGLTFQAGGFALAAMLARGLLSAPFLMLYFLYIYRGLGLTQLPQTRSVFLRFMLVTFAGQWATDPFGILGAGLYAEHGLGPFLFFAVGSGLAAWLGRRFSQASERSRSHARQLERLEQLSRALLAAPPDASTLHEVLKDHLPGMFPVGRVDIRIFPDTLLAHYPPEAALASDKLWPWLKTQSDIVLFDSGHARPWLGAPEPEIVLAAPILDEDTRLPLGGVCLTHRPVSGFVHSLDARQAAELIPAMRAFAGQIASALRRAEIYRQMLAHEKRQQELAFAGQVQASFLPAATPNLPGWQIAAGLEPARETSGDFYDFIELPDGCLGLVVADVTDKGTGAALYMAMSRTLIRTFAVTHYPDPVAALTAANARLLADSRIEMFVTVFFGILDPATGQLTYCNAGHNPPYIFSGAARALTHTLRRTGTPLGVLDDVTWNVGAAQLAPGDVCVLYTDGVTEAQNDADGFWGEARLQAVTLANLGRCAADVRAAVLDDIHAFVGRAPQSDDITLMVIARE
jgi:serine phosphatase RsbU (regulator of sigma subunit)